MANFGLKFKFLVPTHNCCGQKDSTSKIATKVYTARYPQAMKPEWQICYKKIKKYKATAQIAHLVFADTKANAEKTKRAILANARTEKEKVTLQTELKDKEYANTNNDKCTEF